MWTLTTVHSYWFRQTLRGEKVALKVRIGLQSKKKPQSDSAESTEKWCKNILQGVCLGQAKCDRCRDRCVIWNAWRAFIFLKSLHAKVSLVKFQVLIINCRSDWQHSAGLLPLPCPVLELPPCPRVQVQLSFPGLTVYSNYQANKGPPCAVMGKGRGAGSWTRGFHFGKCVW